MLSILLLQFFRRERHAKKRRLFESDLLLRKIRVPLPHVIVFYEISAQPETYAFPFRQVNRPRKRKKSLSVNQLLCPGLVTEPDAIRDLRVEPDGDAVRCTRPRRTPR